MTTPSSTAHELLRRLTSSPALSVRDVTRTITDGIHSGMLQGGERLPTIRQLADASGLSTASMSGIWSLLSDRGLIETRKRGGSYVATTNLVSQGLQAAPFNGWAEVDLVTAHPTHDYQPDLQSAFARSLRDPSTNSVRREFITSSLLEAVAPSWPFEPESWTTVSGAAEAVLVVIEAVTGPTGLVAIAQPTTPGTVGNLRALGLEVVGVDCDASGPLPDSLAAALAAGAGTFLYQPGGEFSVDSTVTSERLDELAHLLERLAPQCQVVEEDILGPLSRLAPLSLGKKLPGRVTRLTSYCRAFGLDLRTTVIGGPSLVLERVRALRGHGALAQSRILQNALAALLLDPVALGVVGAAAAAYTRKRDLLSNALGAHGLESHHPAGSMVLWIPVADHGGTLFALSMRGIVLVPGQRTFATLPERGLLRITTPQLPEDLAVLDQFATTISETTRDALLSG